MPSAAAGWPSARCPPWPAVFTSLDLTRTPVHVLLLASTGAAVVLLVATRGRLGMPARRADG